MRELDFSPGASVEVNIDPDNSPDVWFPATFIREVTDNSFLVEYQSSKEAGLQEVAVDFGYIRPSPPQLNNRGFSLLEKVDALHDFRWLSGVVTKILAGGRYIVYFKCTKKEKELSSSDLRFHMEWANGKWVHSSEDSLITSASGKQLDSSINDGHKEKTCIPARDSGTNEHVREERNHTVILNSGHLVLQTPCSENADNKSTMASNKRIIDSSVEVATSRLKSPKRTDKKNAYDSPLSPETFKSRLNLTDVLLDGESTILDSSPPDDAGKISSKQSEDINQSSNLTGKMGDDEQPVRRKRGRPPKTGQSPKPQALEQDTALQNSEASAELQALVQGRGKKPKKTGKSPKLQALEQDIAVQNTEASADLQALVQDVVEETLNKSEDFFPHGPIVVGLTHNGKNIESVSGSSGAHMKGESRKAAEDEEKHNNAEVNHESVGSEQQKNGEVTNLKRKRGRPPKALFRVGTPVTKEAEQVVVEGEDYVSNSKDTSGTIYEVENPGTGSESAGIHNSNPSSGVSRKRRQNKVAKSHEEILRIEASEPLKPVTLGRGRRQKPTKHVPSEDTGYDLREKATKAVDNGVSGDLETPDGTLKNISDDDRPLSAWFEGTNSPPTDGRHEIIKTEDFSQLRKEKALDGEDETPIQSTAIVPVDNQDLPFVKTSLIWAMIESMDVIKRIPQKPHFRPLYNSKEECREGLAVGSMVTFTSLVDRISRLQFDDPESVLDGYVEALVDLEELGFNVGPVRDRLNTLMSIKVRYEQTQNTANEIETRMVEHDDEKSRIDEEIEEIDAKLAELNVRRVLAMSKREMKEAEMRLLKSSVNDVKGFSESAKEEFEKVATSSW